MRTTKPSLHRVAKLARRLAACTAGAALAFSALTLPAVAGAQEDTAASKLGRGVAGVTLGILEIPGNIVQETRTNGVLSGMTVGFVVGVGKFVARELVGVYEIVTAPIPIPRDYAPVLAPEYAWNYFGAEPGVVYGFRADYLSDEATELEHIPGISVERGAGALTIRFPEDPLFAVGSAELTSTGRARFQEVGRVLQNNPDSQIFLAGYTDSTGDPDFNQALSQKRAAAVRAALLREGVAPERIEYEGFGDANPVASNDTYQGRASNRRVEMQLRSSGVGANR